MQPAGPQDWEVRTAAYRHLIDTFAAPGTDDLARFLDMPVAEIEASLQRLAAGHQIVLAPGETRIWMLHPFSAIPTEFPVEVEGGTYWGNCAWDALGIPVVLGRNGNTRTRCAESGTAIEFDVRDGGLTGGSVQDPNTVIHFAVPARHWYDNIAFT
jgi:hypothetical protein